MWLNKEPSPPNHEYIIIETKDTTNDESRLFLLERVLGKHDCPPDEDAAKENSERQGTYNGSRLLDGLSKFILPPSPLSLMEEGTSTPTSGFTPVSFPDPRHGLCDTVSLSATKAARVSHAVSDSKDKGDSKMCALDRVQGGNLILSSRYGCGRNARQIKPKGMSLFNLIVLAQVVHNFAPHYSTLNRNCYWYTNMIFDACLEIFQDDESTTPEDDKRKKKFELYDSTVSGRWLGWKVSHTDRNELSVIVSDYKQAHHKAFNKVKIVFISKLEFLTNSEQIVSAQTTRIKADLVDQYDYLRDGQSSLIKRKCSNLMQEAERYTGMCFITFVIA